MRGVYIKVISERLGHADVSTTLKIYAHVLPGRDQAAATAVADVIFGPDARESVRTDDVTPLDAMDDDPQDEE
ncbi:hypothetical protein FDG2_6172 [Candidatus Protofrankia californiensis]|uniref:Tyr recombinase domain-containing protein n=1 Tax=Candidatus Protofrankia californiensis TaxID=1839754 RepID=A0A1C3PGE9_9ACTN|nr:hypothetical protein FDG2_6172 [Candidatus Protofrankia californiensis]